MGDNETQPRHDRKRTPAESCLCSLVSADIASTLIGSLAWLVVTRNATIPMTGPRGGTYAATLAAIVQTQRPRFVVALTISMLNHTAIQVRMRGLI